MSKSEEDLIRCIEKLATVIAKIREEHPELNVRIDEIEKEMRGGE